MGMFFNNDKKSYCGKYKGIDVWQYGSMIGNNWYGDFYVTIPKGKTKRNMKVADSVCRSLEAVKGYIDRHFDELYDSMVKEEAVIRIMNGRGIDKIHLDYLIDLGDEEECDGDLYAITCNAIKVVGDKAIVYDDNLENEDGSVDEEDLYHFEKLDKQAQKDSLWALRETIKYLDKIS